MKGDRVLNFEFMSGDRTFSRQSNRTFKSQSLINKDRTMKMIALSTAKIITVLKFNQQGSHFQKSK